MVDTIQELSSLAKRLNEKSNSINASVTTINTKLAKLNIGLDVWLVNFRDRLFTGDWEETIEGQIGDMPRKRLLATLGYTQLFDAWQLSVKFATETESYNQEMHEVETDISGVEYQPLLKASRGIRIAALPLVPSLLDAIKDRAEDVLRDIEAAEKAADKL